MSYNINKVMVEGNLTRDPELKALPSGTNVAAFSIATNRKYKDKDGNLQEEAEYHNITVFGSQAENCTKYLTKGSSAMVEGRLQTRSWEKDGVKHYRTEVVADRVTFGGKRQESSMPTNTATPHTAGNTEVTYPEEDINPEDVPF